MALLAAKGLLLLVAVLPDRRAAMASMGWLSFLFLVSGFAAMIYQIVWQRALFTLYGVNIESVTMIVTVFMLGLGMGSLAAFLWLVSAGVASAASTPSAGKMSEKPVPARPHAR